MFAERMEDRRKNFKKAVDADETRRRREDEAVQLRKSKKEEMMAKKRFMPEFEDQENENSNVQQVPGAISTLAQQLVQTQDPQVKLQLTETIRRRLSREENPPIYEVIQAGLVPVMVGFLKAEDQPQLQFEAAWVLTNVASGTQEETQAVVNAGAVPLFVALLASSSVEMVEQAIWAIGNIAGDSIKLRDYAFSLNTLDALLRVLVANEAHIKIVRQATWALSNLFRGKPAPDVQFVQTAAPFFSQLVHIEDTTTLADAHWGLSYMSDAPPDRVQVVIECGVAAKAVAALGHSSSQVVRPALRTCGNISTSTDLHTQELVKAGILDRLPQLLTSTKKQIRKDAAWLLSNITAGTSDQVQSVVDSPNVPHLIELAADGDFDVRKEAVWALANACIGGKGEICQYLSQQGIIASLCSMLDAKDHALVGIILDALHALLRKTAEINGGESPFTVKVEECDGLTQIEYLQEDDDHNIYHKAMMIITDFFSAEEDAADDAGDADAYNAGGATFNFA